MREKGEGGDEKNLLRGIVMGGGTGRDGEGLKEPATRDNGGRVWGGIKGREEGLKQCIFECMWEED